MAEINTDDIERFLNSIGIYESVGKKEEVPSLPPGKEEKGEEEGKEEARPSILFLIALAVGALLLARGGRT